MSEEREIIYNPGMRQQIEQSNVSTYSTLTAEQMRDFFRALDYGNNTEWNLENPMRIEDCWEEQDVMTREEEIRNVVI